METLAVDCLEGVFMRSTFDYKSVPKRFKDALCIASCFGACIDDIVVNEGLMNKRGDQYHFVHDRVQEEAYGMMNPEDRGFYHL